MKKLTLVMTALLLALGATRARAATFGSLSFTVWNGTAAEGVSDQAALSSLSGLPFFPAAFFSYTGPIDFVNDASPGASNTFADFFGANASGISNFMSPILTEDAFLALPMSTAAGTADAINSFFQITGIYTAATAETFALYHADGASLYTGINNANEVFAAPSPTTGIVTSSGTLPAAVSDPFTLLYVDTNGAPAVLSTSNPTPVPEPTSLALFASGIFFLGLVGFASDARRARLSVRFTLDPLTVSNVAPTTFM